MIQKPRGTLDYFGDSINELNFVFEKIKEVVSLYNLKEIKTPTFEHSELFKKNIGNETDIISKEIYEFQDKSNRNIALRPEGTAPVVRSYVENKMFGNQNYSLKLYYIMNMFRYERPQSGRLREFYQFGVEYFKTNSKYDIIEIIQLAVHIFKAFEFDKYILKINNIGDFEQRSKWKTELIKYFEDNIDFIPINLRKKALINPFRILDSKEEIDKNILENAPKLDKFLTEKDKKEFLNLIKILNNIGIKVIVDNNLVRGLDYYTNVVFEFISTSDVLGKSTIIGGGNYTKLINDIGGPEYDGLGFAMGIERFILCLKENNFNFKIKKYKSIFVFAEENFNLNNLFLLNSFLREKYSLNVHCLYNEYKKQKINKYCLNNEIEHILWLFNDNIKLENLKTKKIDEYTFDEIINKGLFL